MASPGPPMVAAVPGKADDGVVFLHVAADEFVGLRDLDDFLHARHFFERALFDFALVAGDADGGASGARHGMSAISKFFDFLANSAHLLFGGLRLHDDQHNFPLGRLMWGQRLRLSGRAKLDSLTAAAGEAASQVYRCARLPRKWSGRERNLFVCFRTARGEPI